MNVRCPCCGSQYSLEVALQSDAGRELLAVMARLPEPLSRALFAYLGLFRPAERVLTWSRTLRLAEQVLALAPPHVLLPALEETVIVLRERQAEPGWKPMKNHNYLKRVLETVEASQVVTDRLPQQEQRAVGKVSKHRSALSALDD